MLRTARRAAVVALARWRHGARARPGDATRFAVARGGAHACWRAVRCGLTVEALCTWRDAHAERRHTDAALRVEKTASGVLIEGAYRIAGPGFESDEEWYVGRLSPGGGGPWAQPRARTCTGWVGSRPTSGSATRLEISAWAGDAEALATPPPPAREVVEAARRRARALTGGTGDDDRRGADARRRRLHRELRRRRGCRRRLSVVRLPGRATR